MMPAFALITTSSLFSSLEWTPLDDSESARSGGDVELSVEFVSDLGVNASFGGGIPESPRRMKRGVDVYSNKTQ